MKEERFHNDEKVNKPIKDIQNENKFFLESLL